MSGVTGRALPDRALLDRALPDRALQSATSDTATLAVEAAMDTATLVAAVAAMVVAAAAVATYARATGPAPTAAATSLPLNIRVSSAALRSQVEGLVAVEVATAPRPVAVEAMSALETGRVPAAAQMYSRRR